MFASIPIGSVILRGHELNACGLIRFCAGDRVVFVYGFPKNANLNTTELDSYRKLAQIYLSFSSESITKALEPSSDYNVQRVEEMVTGGIVVVQNLEVVSR